MKTRPTFLGIIAAYSFALLLNITSGNAQCNYNTNYTTAAGWVLNGGGYSFGPTFNFNATPGAAWNYASTPLGCTLDNTSWCADVDFFYAGRSATGVAHSLMSFTRNALNSWNVPPGFGISNNNVIETYINCPPNAAIGTETIHANSKANTTWGVATPGIVVAPGNNYFLRLQRLSATQGLMSVFLNAARTIHAPGSPQCFNIIAGAIGLGNLQQGCIPQGSSLRTLTGTLSNMRVTSVTPGITGVPVTTVCANTVFVACIQPMCGASYNWTVPAGSIITAGQGSTCITVSAGTTSGPISCTTVIPGAPCSVTQSATLNVSTLAANAGPPANLCCGTIWYLGGMSGSASGGVPSYTYSWSPTTYIVGSSTIANPVITDCSGVFSVTYTLTVTDASGCVATSTVLANFNNTAPCRQANPSIGNATSAPSAPVIAPNPATGNFMITFSSADAVREIEVTNTLGQVVYRESGITAANVFVNLTGQPQGLYIVKMRDGDELFVQNVVLE